MHIKDLNLNKIWQDSFNWQGENINTRKLNDDLEREFWVKLAPYYTDEYDLNKDTPLLAEALAKRIEPGSTILEIGPGSGNFTIKMAEYAGNIIGVDFSSAMLEQLEKRAQKAGLTNISLINSKWEDYKPQGKNDYIVSVNSLYRIRDMESALMKMYECCNRGIILLRTIQRPYFYGLYKALRLACDECWDYQLMPMYFWRKDIYADVEFLDYKKKKIFATWQLVTDEIRRDLGEEQYQNNQHRIISTLKEVAISTDDSVLFVQPRITVVITVKK